ncbi:MAG: FAD-dependent oxidoreductase [Gemmatimonadota bacterium]
MPPRLVLAGLGHAHLFVLEAVRAGRLPPCDLVVCSGERRHVYSGMVPGWLAGRYTLDELSLDTASMVRDAGGRWRDSHVMAIDPSARLLTLVDGTTESYDVCSIAVGSAASGMSLPGVADHAFPLKPLRAVEAIGARLDAIAREGGGAVFVIGGGLAGVEVALALRARAASQGAATSIRVAIVSRDASLAADGHPRLSRQLQLACERHGVELLLQTHPVQVRADSIALQRGDARFDRETDLVVWATGAESLPWLRESGLPVDERGSLLVNDQLRSVGDRRVHAAGDCATLATAPGTPKAGVYAVRMGPYLASSLANALGARHAAAPFHPQRRFLALVNTGDGRAIASYGAVVAEGKWAMRWKDWLDRRFIARFAPAAPRDSVR